MIEMSPENILDPRRHGSDWRDDDRPSRGEYYLLLSPPLSKELCGQRFGRHA